MKKATVKLAGCGLIFCLCIMLLIVPIGIVRADTGTYTLTYQNADLFIQTTGDVVIHYNISMSVQSGNIPWVTVGLPTSNYEIRSYNGSAASVVHQDSGSWSGVYASLDRTYYAGEQFSFAFEVLEKDFIYKYNDQQASLQFTPCWWDNAYINTMTVTFHIPPEIQSVTTTSQPTMFSGSTIIWQWNNIPAGQKESTGVLMPLAAFSHVKEKSPFDWISNIFSSSNCVLGFIVGFFTLIIIIFIFAARSRGRSEYENPQMFTGGFHNLIRHINLDCPNDKTRLDRRSFHGTTIDFCDTCGGSFFDKGEIEQLLDSGVNEQEFNTKKVLSFQDFSSPIGKCPRCNGTIETVTRSDNYKDYSIYVCKDCRGIWLNKGLYQAIKDKRLEQDKTQEEKLKLVGDNKAEEKKAYYAPSWWWFYPYIFYPHQYGRFIAPPSPPVVHSCACVSCACVSSCACACACAGGGAAGCTPKDTMWPQISFHKK